MMVSIDDDNGDNKIGDTKDVSLFLYLSFFFGLFIY